MLPPFLGIKKISDISLENIIPLINWKMYFAAWDLRPSLYTDVHRSLEEDSRKILSEIVEQNSFEAKAVVGFFPVQRTGDSLDVLDQDGNKTERLHFLRKQYVKEGEPLISIADFFNPKERDCIGLFVATIFGAEHVAQKYVQNGDDYSALIVKLLADRLVEAFTEKVHNDLLGGVGVRMAPGYPAAPDHSEKKTIWNLLSPNENIGTELSETFIMIPAASESGYFIMHPKSFYFNLGKIGEDQLADYAKRKHKSVEEIKKFLVV